MIDQQETYAAHTGGVRGEGWSLTGDAIDPQGIPHGAMGRFDAVGASGEQLHVIISCSDI